MKSNSTNYCTVDGIMKTLYLQLYRLTFWTRHSSQIRLQLKDNENHDKAPNETTPIVDADSSTTASNDSVNEPQPAVDITGILAVYQT